MGNARLPPGQQLAAPGKWPLVGERLPERSSDNWSVSVTGCVHTPRTYSLAELSRLPQADCAIDIHCVTRWSMLGARFSGVLLDRLIAEAQPTKEARYINWVADSPRRHATSMPLDEALALGTLVALTYEGAPLPSEHGGPVRCIVPRRYFYKSVKWLIGLELLAEDRLGYWEGTAGYHNHADPWREERFIASQISRQEAATILARRDISGRELLGLDAAQRELRGLQAQRAVLRNASFVEAQLAQACFDGANLSNARFVDACLRNASFVGADLEGADFTGADLRGARFDGASLFGASFVTAGVDGSRRESRFDADTHIAVAALEMLMPGQAEFVREQLALREKS